ncbi:hypothetical protein EAb13_CDS0122 [Acinetobacter phage EAb13]|nr:hypothetical protein EAb13_CDS0004 [Acinetobacter phage EAb13]WGH24540.1 hypothetical protein EAb13_CDS0122 [Acinetobacter phage EAb13]
MKYVLYVTLAVAIGYCLFHNAAQQIQQRDEQTQRQILNIDQ